MLQPLNQNDSEASQWQVSCNTRRCSDRRVKLLVRQEGGTAILTRRLAEVVYQPPYIVWRSKRSKPRYERLGELTIQCGDSNLRAIENYPAALCGKLYRTLLVCLFSPFSCSHPPPPLPPCGGVPRMQKLNTQLGGAQGYQRFPLASQNIALDAVPAYRASFPT